MAPILTNPRANFTTLTTTIPSCHTDSASGVIYMVLITDLIAVPSADQIKAGQNGFGASVTNENITVSLGGTQTFTELTGLNTRTDYALYFVHEKNSKTSEVQSIAFNTLKTVADIEETFPDSDGGISGTQYAFWTWDDQHTDYVGWDAEIVIGSPFETGDDDIPHVPDDPGGIEPT